MPATSSPSGPWQFAHVFRNTRPPSSMSWAVLCCARREPPARSAPAIARREHTVARIRDPVNEGAGHLTVGSRARQSERVCLPEGTTYRQTGPSSSLKSGHSVGGPRQASRQANWLHPCGLLALIRFPAAGSILGLYMTLWFNLSLTDRS